MSYLHGGEKLVYMANQIAGFFASQGGDVAAAQTADHLKSYWPRAMHAEILQYLEAGGTGLSPIAADAIAILRDAPAGSVRKVLAGAGKPTSRAPGDDAG